MEEEKSDKMVYVEEDVAHVNRILAAPDFYKILAVPETATESEIKNAYRRIALLVHPDKNKSPRANEAFNELKTAAAVLIDKNKRTEYDELLRTGGSSKYTLCLSESEIDALLIATSVIGVGLGLFGLYKWLTGGSKDDTKQRRVN